MLSSVALLIVTLLIVTLTKLPFLRCVGIGNFFPCEDLFFKTRSQGRVAAPCKTIKNPMNWGAPMIFSLNTRSIACHRFLYLFAFLLLFLPNQLARAQALSQSAPVTTTDDAANQRIRRQLTELNTREMANASNRELGYRWAVLGLEYSNASQFTSSENAYNHAIDLLGKDPADASLQAEALDQLGALYTIYNRLPEALNCRRKALALRVQLGNPQLIARSRSHLAEIALEYRQYREAFREADEAYNTMKSTTVVDSDVISALVVRTYATCGLHRRTECLSDAQQVLALSRTAFPEQSPEVSSSLMALSVAQLDDGSPAAAEESARQALAILKVQFSANDPRMVFALSHDRDCLVAMHRKEEARQVEEQLAALQSKSAASCAQCTVSAFGLRAPSH